MILNKKHVAKVYKSFEECLVGVPFDIAYELDIPLPEVIGIIEYLERRKLIICVREGSDKACSLYEYN